MKKICAVMCSTVLLLSLHALPTLAVFKITDDGIGEKAAQNINDALYSFLSENKQYDIIDCRTFASPASENVPKTDYLFYGTLSKETDDITVNLILETAATGVTKLLSKNYPNANLILLDSRQLMERLLDPNYEPEIPVAVPVIGEGLSGTWIGEPDIKSIKLLKNGRGIILFNSGFSISVDFIQKGESITVVQKSAVTGRQFPHIPKELTAEALKNAKPLRWILKLHNGVLQGTRSETAFIIDGNKIKSTQNQLTDVKWVKIE